METKELKKAAKEFNKVIVLDSPLNLKSENLGKELHEAITEHREPEDEFTAETEAVFAELAKMYAKPKKEKKSKKEKEIKVKAGTTVELDADTNEVKIEKMKKEKKSKKEKGSEKEPKIGNVVLIKTILDRQVKKDELLNLIENEEVFAKSKKALKKVTNFMSLKKQMLEVFPADEVKALREEMPPIPRGEKKPKAEKKDVLTTAIEDATKVKELKKIAKGNPDKFSWKKLKKLDFEEMQKAMLGGKKDKAKKEPAKPKMIPNPVIGEINTFTKFKKLAAWVEEKEIELPKKLKKYKKDIDSLKSDLLKDVPAEIEVKSSKGGARAERRESNAEERKALATELIETGEYTRPELTAKMNEAFPGYEKANSNLLSECKSTRSYKDGERWESFGLDRLVTVSKKGKYRFASKK